MENIKKYYVYILYCENNNYYTGYTANLIKRYKAHVNGTASKYTRSFKPLKIAQYWETHHKSSAMRLESRIKKLSRQLKEKIIAKPSLVHTLWENEA